ncbi:calmin [Aplochiton taeniatus]
MIRSVTSRLSGERHTVKKRTFTRWINIHLARCDPPIEVLDLFKDIQDGRILMALLEQLSGCKLLSRFRPASHHIFKLNNISKALAFLDDRHVKLVSIDASSIADGSPAVVLGLVWNIILFFQIKEVTRGLHQLSSSLTSLSINSYPSFGDLSPPPCDIITSHFKTLPSKGKRAAKTQKYNGKSINILLYWVQMCTSKFGVEVCDFSKSWMSGLAFLALIKSIDPGLVDLWGSLSEEPKENVEEAFRIAEHCLGIPRLLEPEDVTSNPPDEQSIITYVSQFLQHYHGLDEVREKTKPQTLSFFFSNQPRKCVTESMGSLRLNKDSSDRKVRSRPGKVAEEQALGELCVDKTNVFMSANEGVYSVSALDSDEEDAYSYILGLNMDPPDLFESHDLNQQQACPAQETERELRPESGPRGLLDSEAERGSQLWEASGAQNEDSELGSA